MFWGKMLFQNFSPDCRCHPLFIKTITFKTNLCSFNKKIIYDVYDIAVCKSLHIFFKLC